jgi:TolB-like protein
MQFLFADYTLDIGRRELRYGPVPVAVQPQVFDLLTYLVQNRDRVVSKDHLVKAIWSGRIVSDAAIASRINAARTAVGDCSRVQTMIRTVPRKGFRFVGDVREGPQAGEPPRAGHPPPAGPREQRPALQQPDRPSIAVLPFVNMSSESRQDYFSDGITEDIITALSKVRRFRVVARNSSFTFKGKAHHVKQIAGELGAGYLVEGSVRKHRDCVRITARLSDAATGRQLWAERYDRCLHGAFAVQDEIAGVVVASVEPQVYAAERLRTAHKSSEGLAAPDLAMRALSHFSQMTREDNAAAQALLRKAVAIDPNCAQAHAVLVASLTFSARMGWEDRQIAVPAAERAALAAIRADDEDPWAHFAMGAANLHLARFDDALAAFDKALSLNPNFSLAQAYCGRALADVGRWKEGIDAARRALQLNPRDPFAPIYSVVLAYAALVGRDYDEAMRVARGTIRQRPGYVGSHRVFVAAAAMKGEVDVAKAALHELRRTQPNISLAWLASQMPVVHQHCQEGFRRIGLD